MTRKVSPDGRGTVERQPSASSLAGRVTLRLGGWVLEGAAIATLALVVLASLLRPVVPWDSWAYHLPFSAWLWDIGDARRTFILGEQLSARYAGFPLFAEFLQGALWKASGSMAASTLVNSASLCALVAAAGIVIRGSLPIMAFGSLSIPLVAFHSTSNYIDLFVAVMICLQVLAAWQLERRARQAHPAPMRRTLGGWSGIFILAAAAAGNSKFQALVVSMAVSSFLALYLISNRAQLVRGVLPRLVLVLALASVLSLATAARNTVAFGNPFYPVRISLPALGVTLPGTEVEYVSHPNYAESLGAMSRPIYWVLSVTEIDWQVRQVPATYNIDANAGDQARRFGPGRTGGTWGPFIACCCSLLLWLSMLAFRRNPAGFQAGVFILLLFIFLTVLTAFMPQSHEIRYYLYWPILLLLVICTFAEAARLSTATRLGLSLAFAFAFLWSQKMLDFSLRALPAQPTAELAMVHSPEIEFARRTGGVCLGPSYSPMQFAYAAVFHGGRYVIEQGWEGCSRHPPYPR